MLSAVVVDYLWVGGGAILTLVLGVALLYWIDAEWQTLDRRHRQLPDASRPPAEAPALKPPDESAAPPD